MHTCFSQRPTHPSRNLVRFARHEKVDSIVLLAQLIVEVVLEPLEGGILVARDGDSGSLVA